MCPAPMALSINSAIYPRMDKICELFRDRYLLLYQKVLFDFYNETGQELGEYKELEPELLLTFCDSYVEEPFLFDQVSKLLSHLILLQSLPNANHRAAFLFIRLYLKNHSIGLKTYLEEKEVYDEFYRISKPIIENDVNHNEVPNSGYFDAHHIEGMARHLKAARELLKKIITPQSGMTEAEPFHSFIASSYQDGS